MPYGGESGGQPRNMISPEAFVEDFSAAVDYMGTRPFVDRERIGVIGICAEICDLRQITEIVAVAHDPVVEQVGWVYA